MSCLFGIHPSAVRVAVRGFEADDERVVEHLEEIGRIFLRGYHLGLSECTATLWQQELTRIPDAYLGFAHEGIAMGLGVRDIIFCAEWKRVQRFIDDFASRHIYLAYVGIGWAIAAIPWSRGRLAAKIANLDPLLRWLAVDGYGFYHGYFHWPQYGSGRRQPDGLSGYLARTFDQGLGRSLWFVAGADPQRIKNRISQFLANRQGDLWSGVGLACAYAGGVDRYRLCQLRNIAGPYQCDLALGAVFAAKSRQLASNLTLNTADACDILCAMNPANAADLCDRCLLKVDSVPVTSRYEAWRQAIRSHFVESPTTYRPTYGVAQ